MSSWIINDIRLYEEVGRELPICSKNLEQLNNEVNTALNDLLRDLKVDHEETDEELERCNAQQSAENKSGQSGENCNEIQQRKYELESLMSEVEHMIISFRNVLDESQRANAKMQRAQQIMNQFLSISESYLKQQSNSGNVSSTQNDVVRNQNDSNSYRFVGDAFHFTKSDSLSQGDISKLEQDISQSGRKGNKISIDRVSQLDFDLLEKNGYAISENGPNDYSAYKLLDKKP
jgi:hypothetical protein